MDEQEQFSSEIHEANERGWGKTTVFDWLRALIFIKAHISLPGSDGLVDTKTFDINALGGDSPGNEVAAAKNRINRFSVRRRSK